jgi:hypothetical protein
MVCVTALNLTNLFSHRLDAGSFKAPPAVPEWSDFDDCHGPFAFSAKEGYMFT